MYRISIIFDTMALWQIPFIVLPATCLQSQTTFEKEDDMFDDSPFWQAESIKSEYFDEISRILPRSKSWSDALIMYGDNTSNVFEIFVENEIVQSVSFRIDFTSKYEIILRQLIEFCLLKGLIILDQNLDVVPLNFESVKERINSMPQIQKYNYLLKATNKS